MSEEKNWFSTLGGGLAKVLGVGAIALVAGLVRSVDDIGRAAARAGSHSIPYEQTARPRAEWPDAAPASNAWPGYESSAVPPRSDGEYPNVASVLDQADNMVEREPTQETVSEESFVVRTAEFAGDVATDVAEDQVQDAVLDAYDELTDKKRDETEEREVY
jgi:hypothetical protein